MGVFCIFHKFVSTVTCCLLSNVLFLPYMSHLASSFNVFLFFVFFICQVDAQLQVVRKLEEKERLLQGTISTAERELALRTQALDMNKRKVTRWEHLIFLSGHFPNGSLETDVFLSAILHAVPKLQRFGAKSDRILLEYIWMFLLSLFKFLALLFSYGLLVRRVKITIINFLMFLNSEGKIKNKRFSVYPAGSGLCAAVGGHSDAAGTGSAETQPSQRGSCRKQHFPRKRILQCTTGSGNYKHEGQGPGVKHTLECAQNMKGYVFPLHASILQCSIQIVGVNCGCTFFPPCGHIVAQSCSITCIDSCSVFLS